MDSVEARYLSEILRVRYKATWPFSITACTRRQAKFVPVMTRAPSCWTLTCFLTWLLREGARDFRTGESNIVQISVKGKGIWVLLVLRSTTSRYVELQTQSCKGTLTLHGLQGPTTKSADGFVELTPPRLCPRLAKEAMCRPSFGEGQIRMEPFGSSRSSLIV